MQDRNDDIYSNTGFKADNFDEEKKKADEIEVQNNSTTNNTDEFKKQETLKQQHETD